jgi:hypothetical protein
MLRSSVAKGDVDRAVMWAPYQGAHMQRQELLISGDARDGCFFDLRLERHRQYCLHVRRQNGRRRRNTHPPN